MKLLTIASIVLLAGGVAAAPGTALRRERNLKRAARKSGLMTKVEAPEGYVTNKTNVDYSGNWAGAVLVGTGYTSVTGTFTVPKPSTAGSGSAWVGIDGDTCGSAILQTGVDWTKSGSSYTYDAWYEWYPADSFDFSGISISAGDQITATVKATSKTGGTATLHNISTGKTVTHTFSNEGSEGDLCEKNAEWIIEDFEEGGGQVQFADFGTVTFTGASATKGGSSVGTNGATVIDMQSESGSVITDCSISSSSEVSCSYV